MDVSIRHTLATFSYRLGKVLRDTPPEFRDFGSPDNARTPGRILAHINDLMDWALSQPHSTNHLSLMSFINLHPRGR